MADCTDDLVVDLYVAFPSECDVEDQVASFQALEAVDPGLQVHLALASSLGQAQDNSLDQMAFQVSASFLVGPFEVALAFGFHLALFA